MSEADSGSESEGEFTIKTNSHLSSAMNLVLNSSEVATVAEVEGAGALGEGGGWGGARGAGWRVGLVGGAQKALELGERCCAEAADNLHTRSQACRIA